MFISFRRSSILLFVTMAVYTEARAASVFNFDSDAPGTTTAFTDTNGGISASFSSAVPGAFIVDPPGVPASFITLTGNTLAEPGAAGLDNQSLTITFSPNITSISFVFAVNATVPTPLDLAAFLNGTPAGTASATEPVPTDDHFPEGTLVFSAANFNSVILSSPAPDFAIDDIVVTAVAPEPSTLPLLGIFLSGLVAIPPTRRRFSRR